MTLSFLILIAALPQLLFSTRSSAETFHYRNMIPGERAAGMGGAFSAISDDPSGVLHNPAGLVYGQGDYLSLSVNAYQFGSINYQNVFSDQDYSLSTSALVPVFFGFTQQLGPGKLGFGVFVTEMQIFDQNDRVDQISSNTNELFAINRQLSKENIQYLAGPSYSLMVSQSLSVGLTLFGGFGKEKVLDMQTAEFAPEGIGKYLIQNTYYKKQNFTVQPKLGVIFSPASSLSLSATVSKGFYITGSGEYRVLTTKGDDSGTPTPPAPNGELNHDYLITSSTNLYSQPILPFEFTLGIAYFVDESLLLAADSFFYTSDSDYLGPDQPQLTWNASLGAELYLTERLPIRAGIFTNRTNQRSLQTGRSDQYTHVDLYGFTFGFSLKSDGSALGLTIIHSKGTGEGQILGGSTSIQGVQQDLTSVLFSGTYEM